MPRTRNSPVRKVTVRTPEEKLRTLRALYMLVYNEERSVVPLSVELFHTIGEILEGVPPEDLDLHLIDKAALLKELASNN